MGHDPGIRIRVALSLRLGDNYGSVIGDSNKEQCSGTDNIISARQFGRRRRTKET